MTHLQSSEVILAAKCQVTTEYRMKIWSVKIFKAYECLGCCSFEGDDYLTVYSLFFFFLFHCFCAFCIAPLFKMGTAFKERSLLPDGANSFL